MTVVFYCGLPPWLSSKESTCNAGVAADKGWIPGLRRSPGGGHDYACQYPCLENPMDKRTWQATIQRVGKSQTQVKRLSTHAKQAKGWEQKIWKYRDLLLQERFYEPSGQKRHCLWQISSFSNMNSCHAWWAILAFAGNVSKICMHFIQPIYQVPQKASTFNGYIPRNFVEQNFQWCPTCLWKSRQRAPKGNHKTDA